LFEGLVIFLFDIHEAMSYEAQPQTQTQDTTLTRQHQY